MKIEIEAKIKGQVAVNPDDHLFLQHQQFIEQSFAGLKKHSFDVLGCTFERCDFSKMKVFDVCFAAGIEQSRYVECRFDGTRFRHLNVGLARFERCSFRDVLIQHVFVHGAEFIDCTFSGTMRGSVLFGRVCGTYTDLVERRFNEIRGNDFSNMKFSDVDFREGVDLRLQRLPSGDNYLHLKDAERKLAALRARYLQQPPSEIREAVFEFLEVLKVRDLYDDRQPDLFLCKDSENMSRWKVDAIWRELAEMPD